MVGFAFLQNLSAGRWENSKVFCRKSMLALPFLALLLSCASLAEAQSYPDLSGSGNSGQRQSSAGSRGSCSSAQGTPRVLIPATNTANTANPHPSMWVYIPYDTEDFHSLEMVIWDNDTPLYETVIPSSNLPEGIVGLTVPSNRPSLQGGKSYMWQVTLRCEDPAETGSVDGDYMEGVLQLATGQNTWYDALTAEGNRLCSSNSSSANLSNLLNMVGYSDIASEPIAACLTSAHIQ